ncbi:ATP-dependent dethiobiotin synthetase BioD [Jatrophihabitans sp. DSM 45814]
MKVIIVTGTGTGIGKTITTAALAACASRSGQRVAVVKPVQTGVRPGEAGDLTDVERLTGLADLHEYVRYAEPLAPATAARRLGQEGPSTRELVEWIGRLEGRDLIIVEGAGGAFVRYNTSNETIVDLALGLRAIAATLGVVVTTGAGLGALHDAAAAAAALAPLSVDNQLVVGRWPAVVGLAERCNLIDLPGYGSGTVQGVLPDGAGELSRSEFGDVAVRSLTRTLGGTFDASEFIRAHAAPAATKVSYR